MMHDTRYAMVPFQGTQLFTIHDGERILVAMKSLVEALGIAWSRQRIKIVSDPVMSKGVTLRVTPSDGGAQETLFLPIDLMQGWLFKLNPDRVAPEARERVIAYQAECYQVLHDYWVKGAAINPRTQLVPIASITETLRMIEAMKIAASPGARRSLYAMIDQQHRLRGLETPPLEDFLHPASRYMRDALSTFIAGWQALERLDIDIDQHRRGDMIALNIPTIFSLFAEHRIERPSKRHLVAALSSHPAFIATRTVNCRDGKTRHCWIMDASFGSTPPQPLLH